MKVEQDAVRPTPAHWWMVGVLCLVNAVAFIGHAALLLLVQPIKRDLAISDTVMRGGPWSMVGRAFSLSALRLYICRQAR
jgi:hypothetical protein